MITVSFNINMKTMKLVQLEYSFFFSDQYPIGLFFSVFRCLFEWLCFFNYVIWCLHKLITKAFLIWIYSLFLSEICLLIFHQFFYTSCSYFMFYLISLIIFFYLSLSGWTWLSHFCLPGSLNIFSPKPSPT